MEKMKGPEKKRLQKMAHNLEPVARIGQKGITENLISAIDKSLDDHELIKIKFVDFKEEKRAMLSEIVEKTGGSLVELIGNVAILYRKNESE